MRGSPFEIRAVAVWHVLILAILSFYVVIGVYAAFINFTACIAIMAFAGPLFSLFLISVVFSKIKVDEDGINFRIYHVSFDEMSGIKLRCGGRLMTYGRKLDLGFILLNPKKFVEAVRTVRPEILS